MLLKNFNEELKNLKDYLKNNDLKIVINDLECEVHVLNDDELRELCVDIFKKEQGADYVFSDFFNKDKVTEYVMAENWIFTFKYNELGKCPIGDLVTAFYSKMERMEVK